MPKITVAVVADSLSPQNHRLTSILATFPKYILAEAKTHRIISQDNNETIVELTDASLNACTDLSKNSASSRAIPTKKLIKQIIEDPFVPIAWQKEHSGMQGTEYYQKDEKFTLIHIKNIMISRLMKMYDTTDKEDSDVLQMFDKVMNEFDAGITYTLDEFWLLIRDKVVICVMLLYCLGVTKQLANRLLEPFMFTTVLMSATEWENFFELRCPVYQHPLDLARLQFKSRKEYAKQQLDCENNEPTERIDDYLYWAYLNKGMADIHMMALAEAIWDAMNESTPKQLQAGEWHIPFLDKFESALGYEMDGSETSDEGFIVECVKVATGMAARTSYTVVGDEKEVKFNTLISIHDKMKVQIPRHSSPMEHCSKTMTEDEYNANVKGYREEDKGFDWMPKDALGWCRNFRGFIQYRHLIEIGKM